MKKKVLFAVLSILLLFILSFSVLETFARAKRHYLDSFNQTTGTIEQFSPTIGWVHIPGSSQHQLHHDFTVDYHIDVDGFRIQSRPSSPVKRVLILGDSFVFGVGVNDEETMAAHLQMKTDAFSFYNAGTSGYSQDQMFLAYEELCPRLPFDVVVVAVYLGNDIQDLPFLYPQQSSRPKPTFKVDAKGNLTMLTEHVVENAKKESTTAIAKPSLLSIPGFKQFILAHSEGVQFLLRARDAFFPRKPVIKPEVAEGLSIFSALMDLFKKETQARHQSLVAVIVPQLSQVHGRNPQLDLLGEEAQEKLSQLGIASINITGPLRALANEGATLYHLNEGHWNAAGHKAAADLVFGFLNDEKLIHFPPKKPSAQ